MTHLAFINDIAAFLPNEPVGNDEMEERLGYVAGRRSRSKPIILRNNHITSRHYALDRKGRPTHTNASLTAEAVRRLARNGFGLDRLEMLACGTTTPDQLLPNHASMVHGELGLGPLETAAFTGACGAGMGALKHAAMAVRSGLASRAVATGSELLSTWMMGRNFEEEARKLAELERNPLIAFEKDFLRWMLSDGAGAARLSPEPNPSGPTLRLDWIDQVSFAGELETCMYAGAEKLADGSLRGWAVMEPREWLEHSVFSLKQDTRLLDRHIAALAGRAAAMALDRHGLTAGDIDLFIPHLSSMYFKSKVAEEFERHGVGIPDERWFVNLTRVGNVGSASVFLALAELWEGGSLKPGQRLLLGVPESARFAYASALVTVA